METVDSGATTHAADLIWRSVLVDLQTSLPASAFEWLRNTRLAEVDETGTATVLVADRAAVEQVSRKFRSDIERRLSDRMGRRIATEYRVDGGAEVPLPLQPRTPVRPVRQPEAPRPMQMSLEAPRAIGLNPAYVLRTYVVGSSNRFAHAAGVSVSEHPGGKYNPLFVHGGVGLGKTHLLHAIGHRVLELHQDLRVSYVTSEKFTNDLIAAIRQQKTDEFRARYREIDVLMIDDIQFIAGKESTQEEFFHTFNALYQSGKQVILSSDKPPKSIAALEERLRSRFEGGLIADVQAPDFEMRLAILRIKDEELGLALPPAVTEYIAGKDHKNIRELEGALNKVVARAQLTGEAMSLDLAIKTLSDSAPGARRVMVTRDDVIDAVLDYFGVGKKDLAGKSRTRENVVPRQIAMYLLRAETDASLIEIGGELGGRDHTTVLHGIRQVEKSLASDAALRAHVHAIREILVA
ncbi:MAG: chromosomal replication initiator protein DnaA [Thermomicrobiales bacterium]